MSDLARRIKAARAYAELTQEELAERLGVSGVTYKRIEAGKRELTLLEVQRIAEITQMPAEFFSGGGAGATERQEELERLHASITGLVHRLEDLEYRMRTNVEKK